MQHLAELARGRVVAAPLSVTRPGALARQTVRIRDGIRTFDALCELDRTGIRIGGATGSRSISWPDVRSVTADRGRVRIVTPTVPIELAVTLEGVVEPDLAPHFAQVLRDGRGGALDQTGALHDLTLAIDRVVEAFGDADDPVVPLAVGGFAAMMGLILLAAVPVGLRLLARVTPAAGSFAILPHVASFDPRVIVAASAGGVALAAAVARVALGPAAAAWARGTGRGWHRNAHGPEDRVRRALASLMLSWRIVTFVAALSIALALPSVFARTIVDAQGLHTASGFPFVSRDVPWSAVSDVVPIAVGFPERADGFVTTLVLADGSRVSTRGRDLVGGSERAFYDFSRAHTR